MCIQAKIADSGQKAPLTGSNTGYSLVEMIVVIIIVAVLASVTMRSMRGATDVARTEETRQELDRLAWAITGNPAMISGGTQISYGYIGDVGALPDSLGALIVNPGGYSTWNGPYIQDKFTDGTGNTEYRIDAWGQTYTYSGGITISSAGGGSTITRELANSVANLLYNSVVVTIADLNHTPPGEDFSDSVRFVLTFPDGIGSTTSTAKSPGSDGLVQFDSIPIGNHQLRMIYIPDNDTSVNFVRVNPGSLYYKELYFATDLW